jgi:hypothetical protein
MGKLRRLGPRLKKRQATASDPEPTPNAVQQAEPVILPGAACTRCEGLGEAALLESVGWKPLSRLSDDERAQLEAGALRVEPCDACGGTGVDSMTEGDRQRRRAAAHALEAIFRDTPRQSRCSGCGEWFPVGQSHTPRECVLLRAKVTDLEATVRDATKLAGDASSRIYRTYSYRELPSDEQLAAADAVRLVADRLDPRLADWRARVARSEYDRAWIYTLDDLWYARAEPGAMFHLVWGDHEGPRFRETVCGRQFDAAHAVDPTLIFPLPPKPYAGAAKTPTLRSDSWNRPRCTRRGAPTGRGPPARTASSRSSRCRAPGRRFT